MKARNIHHDAQLLRDLAIANARTQAELGPLPPGGLPVEPKRKPTPWQPVALQAQTKSETENDAMKLSHMAAAAALGTAGVLAGACQPGVQADGQGAAPPETQVEPVVSIDATSAKSSRPASVEKTAAQSATGAESAPSTSEGNSDLGGAIKLGASYAELRQSMSAHEWSPVDDGTCHTNIVGPDYEEFCASHPDSERCTYCDQLPGLRMCSTDGYCLFVFERESDGKRLEVSMYGDVGLWQRNGADRLFYVSGWRYPSKDGE